ncbi:hypothetical protein QR685DRAFT_541527 [Neurospora intermedia]|uniref:Uncharacterized protein n=1 Tax=Neurospora intermedia TaxID=5142 RepID=A0ABR3DLY6_NEUIN
MEPDQPQPPTDSDLTAPNTRPLEGQELYRAILRTVALADRSALARSMLQFPHGLSDEDQMRHLQECAVFTAENMAALELEVKVKKVKVTKYQSAVGFLRYFALGSRPDIAHVVSVLGRDASNPTRETFPHHLSGLKVTFNHIKGPSV